MVLGNKISGLKIHTYASLCLTKTPMGDLQELDGVYICAENRTFQAREIFVLDNRQGTGTKGQNFCQVTVSIYAALYYF